MKRKANPMKAFAAIFDGDADHVAPWTMAGNAKTVRERVGKAWDADDPALGWKCAKIEGAKVVKIEVRIIR